MQIDIDRLPREIESLHEIIATLHDKNYLLSAENVKLFREKGELLDRIN